MKIEIKGVMLKNEGERKVIFIKKKREGKEDN
jgi:hypothetical protein